MFLSRGHIALLAAALALTAPRAVAQTWIGGGSPNWSFNGNWSPATVPASSQNTQLTFDTTISPAMTNDISGTLTLNSMTFNAGSPVYTLSGNPLAFQTNTSGALPSIVTNSSNSVTISDAITLMNSLTVSGTGDVALNGAIAGAGGLTMSSSGTLTLANAPNTYSGGTSILSGTVQVGADSALGTGPVAVGGGATLIYTGPTSTSASRSFNLGGNGTLAIASGQIITISVGPVSSGFLDGSGTIATNATTGAIFDAITTTPSVSIASNSAKDQFVHFTNSAALNVAAGVNALGTGIANLNGFTNEGSGSITVGAGAKVNASNFQSYGTLTLVPNTTSAPTVFTNTGTAPLGFNGGSRTFIGTSATEDPSGQHIVAYLDLHGQNAIVVGGIFFNYGATIDSSNNGMGTGTIIVEYGSLVDAGFSQNPPRMGPGALFQAGTGPGSATFGNFVFGPGGVNNYIFTIDDATGTPGATPAGNGLASGWGLISAVKRSIGATTTSGNFTWTASPTNPLTVALDTIIGSTGSDLDVGVPMVNFDPTQSYSWTAAQWAGTYSGPTDAATLDADTSFDTSGFLNPIAGTFGWSLDLADQTLSLVYTPSAVPEPGTFVLTAVAGIGWAVRRRCRG